MEPNQQNKQASKISPETLKLRTISREGFSGTIIKDTWTKPRGRVEAREGGGFGWGGGEK